MRGTTCFAIALVALPRVATADVASHPATRAEAERLEANLEYELALVTADRAIAAGGNDRAELAALHLLAGRVAAGLDKPDIAERHFAIALALDVAAALPSGTSPKLTAPFDAARAHQVLLRFDAKRTTGDVTLSGADPLRIVAAVRVHVGNGPDIVHPLNANTDLHGADVSIAVQVNRGDVVSGADVLDEHGNVLDVVRLAPPPVNEDQPSLLVRWPTWAIATGVVLAGAGACAWRASVAQDEWNRLSAGGHDYSELVAIEDRGRSWALAANIGFGLAAAGAVATAVVFATHRESARVQVSITPTSFGVAARF